MGTNLINISRKCARRIVGQVPHLKFLTEDVKINKFIGSILTNTIEHKNFIDKYKKFNIDDLVVVLNKYHELNHAYCWFYLRNYKIVFAMDHEEFNVNHARWLNKHSLDPLRGLYQCVNHYVHRPLRLVLKFNKHNSDDYIDVSNKIKKELIDFVDNILCKKLYAGDFLHIGSDLKSEMLDSGYVSYAIKKLGINHTSDGIGILNAFVEHLKPVNKKLIEYIDPEQLRESSSRYQYYPAYPLILNPNLFPMYLDLQSTELKLDVDPTYDQQRKKDLIACLSIKSLDLD